MENLINILDKKHQNTTVCPNEGKQITLPQSGASYSKHGTMVVHGSGAYLVCGVCGHQSPIGRI